MADTILAVKHLKKYFQTPRGLLHAVDDVSLSIERGKTLGVVGESGCGKSTTGRCILRLIEPTSGEVTFDGRDVVRLSARELKALRKDMQIIFQDPYASLDPRKSVSQIISEPIIINKLLTDKKQIEDRVFQLMETVGLAERLVNTYPHELDGGRRQRIGIARALALNPEDCFVPGLDLWGVSEFKRGNGGSIEIKFADRVKAISLLLECAGGGEEGMKALLDALEGDGA